MQELEGKQESSTEGEKQKWREHEESKQLSPKQLETPGGASYIVKARIMHVSDLILVIPAHIDIKKHNATRRDREKNRVRDRSYFLKSG